MTKINQFAFVLPNNQAALCAALTDKCAVVCDGCSCCLFTYRTCNKSKCDPCCENTCGCNSCKPSRSTETVRPYRKIRFDFSNCSFVALTDCERRRIHFLNCALCELGVINIMPVTFGNTDDTNELMDVCPTTTEEGENILAVCFRHSVRAFSLSGEELFTIVPPDFTRLNLDFVVSGSTQALHFRQNSTSFVTVEDNGQQFVGAIPLPFSLRCLIPDGDGNIFGLFGLNYVFNFILPIYENGVYVLNTNLSPGKIIHNSIRCC